MEAHHEEAPAVDAVDAHQGGEQAAVAEGGNSAPVEAEEESS